jgi:preprotein translocase subunit SecD
MGKKIRTRVILISVVSLVGLYIVFMPHHRWPNGNDISSLSQLKDNLATNIHLGLDLRGGSHLVMKVQTGDAITSITRKNVESAKSKLQEKQWPAEVREGERKTDASGEPYIDQVTVSVPDSTRNSDIPTPTTLRKRLKRPPGHYRAALTSMRSFPIPSAPMKAGPDVTAGRFSKRA